MLSVSLWLLCLGTYGARHWCEWDLLFPIRFSGGQAFGSLEARQASNVCSGVERAQSSDSPPAPFYRIICKSKSHINKSTFFPDLIFLQWRSESFTGVCVNFLEQDRIEGCLWNSVKFEFVVERYALFCPGCTCRRGCPWVMGTLIHSSFWSSRSSLSSPLLSAGILCPLKFWQLLTLSMTSWDYLAHSLLKIRLIRETDLLVRSLQMLKMHQQDRDHCPKKENRMSKLALLVTLIWGTQTWIRNSLWIPRSPSKRIPRGQ